MRLLVSVGLAVAGILAFPRVNGAQATCVLPENSHEARLLAFYEAPLAFSPATVPQVEPTGTVRVGLEVSPIPSPQSSLQHTGVCYLQKAEHTNLSPVFPRPRVAVWLPVGFLIEASYDPPVPIGQAHVNVGSLSLANVQRVATVAGGDVTVMLRAQGSVGRIHGPITCPRSALQLTDSAGACYGTRPSNDTFTPNMFGTDVTVGASLPGGRFAAYVGGGASWLRPRFDVGFHDLTDYYHYYGTHLLVDLTRGQFFGGLVWRIVPPLDLSTQVYVVPSDVTTFRIGLGYRFGRHF